MPPVAVTGCAVWMTLLSCLLGRPIENNAPRPRVIVPETQRPPLLNADPADTTWQTAVKLAPLVPSLPWGAPSEFMQPETEVRVMWDRDALYVRFLCKDDHVENTIHGHDAPVFKGDAVEIFLDPMGDCKEWIELEFNASNDVLDQLFLCTGEPRSDPSLRLDDEVIRRDVRSLLSWDMQGLKSAADRWIENGREIGWIVDVSIPASGFPKRAGLAQFKPMTLRGNFLRYKWVANGTKHELISNNWSPVAFGCPHTSPAAFGELVLEAEHANAGASDPVSSHSRAGSSLNHSGKPHPADSASNK